MKAVGISTIGLDLAKSVFQVHGIDAAGRVVVRRQLRRGEVLGFFARLRPCLVGMEACATAHHWGRELTRLGHTVKLMPPAYVKPYVKRGKTDAADAEAIAEAVTRPTMRFVAVKSMDQQAVLMLHKVRDLLVRQRTMLINALRGHLAEFGVVTARGPAGVKAAIAELHGMQDSLPPLARMALHGLLDRLGAVGLEIRKVEREIVAWCRHDDASRRLMTLPRHKGPVTSPAGPPAAGFPWVPIRSSRPVAGASVIVAITCPTCRFSTRSTTAWVRTCGGVFCQGCTELILLDGERVASDCEAIDDAIRELDDIIAELTKAVRAVNARRCIGQEYKLIS